MCVCVDAFECEYRLLFSRGLCHFQSGGRYGCCCVSVVKSLCVGNPMWVAEWLEIFPSDSGG